VIQCLNIHCTFSGRLEEVTPNERHGARNAFWTLPYPNTSDAQPIDSSKLSLPSAAAKLTDSQGFRAVYQRSDAAAGRRAAAMAA
jgi:hypothetical protein